MAVKVLFPSIACLFLVGLLPACKSNDPPEFGVDEPKGKFFSSERTQQRSQKWSAWRKRTSQREDEAWGRMFDRAKGDFEN